MSLLARSSLTLLLVLSACERTPEPRPEPAPTKSAAEPAAVASPGTAPLVLARGLRIERAAAGADAAAVVRQARERESADGREMVVYVGAKWCEPCQRFHAAAARGELDADFPELTVLEFDLDEDRDRLVAAGYVSQFIPLFVVPNADGRASSRRFEGAVKGEAAVANIAPKLRRLLGR